MQTLTEAPDLYLHEFMRCAAATWLDIYINDQVYESS